MLISSARTAPTTSAREMTVPGSRARNRLLLPHRQRLRVPPTISPLHIVATLWAGGVVWLCTGPVNDLDSYWHVLIGREILYRRTLHGLGTAWLGVPAPPWLTSQWLAEVGMAQTVHLAGWRGLVAVRVVLLALTIAVVARTLLPGRTAALAVPIFAATTFGLISITQDRPQSVSVLGIAVVAGVCARLILTDHPRPRYHLIAAGCLLWAQLHPLWILAPVAFGLVTLLSLTEPAAGRRRARTAAACSAASLLGVLNPHAAGSFLLPFRFYAATGLIREWQPTNLHAGFAAAWALLIAVTVVAWARSCRPVPRIEVGWALLWWAFGAVAFRDVIPSVLLTAPIAVAAAERAWGAALARRIPRPGVREARALGIGTLVAVLPGLAFSAVELSRMNPLRDVPAYRIARYLASRPEPVRTFNAYETAGALAQFGGGKVRLAVDGRADMWGGAYLERVQRAQALEGPWQEVLDGFRPDACVLRAGSPLTVLLERGPHWRVGLTDDPYVLLVRSR